MHLLMVLRESFRGDVHAAIVAGGLARVAGDAVERAAVEELGQARPFIVAQVDEVFG